MEKWNKIVELTESNQFKKEESVQATWELIFSELFGYSRLLNEIDTQRVIQMGSTKRAVSDIILRNQEKDLFIVEVKQHTLSSGYEQLLSYLKLLNLKIGILINKKLAVYVYDNNLSESEQAKYAIDFEYDSEDGEMFVEMFTKPINPEQIVKTILKKKERTKNIDEIFKLVNVDYVTKLVRDNLQYTYTNDEVEEAMKKVIMTVNHQNTIIETVNTNTQLPSQAKIGQVVQSFFRMVSNDNVLSYEMVKNLCNFRYCKEKLNMNYSVLKEVINPSDKDGYRKDKYGHARYYKEMYYFFNKPYLLCSQWTTAQEQQFSNWKSLISIR
jgi:Holliday junction resolvase